MAKRNFHSEGPLKRNSLFSQTEKAIFWNGKSSPLYFAPWEYWGGGGALGGTLLQISAPKGPIAATFFLFFFSPPFPKSFIRAWNIYSQNALFAIKEESLYSSKGWLTIFCGEYSLIIDVLLCIDHNVLDVLRRSAFQFLPPVVVPLIYSVENDKQQLENIWLRLVIPKVCYSKC